MRAMEVSLISLNNTPQRLQLDLHKPQKYRAGTLNTAVAEEEAQYPHSDDYSCLF